MLTSLSRKTARHRSHGPRPDPRSWALSQLQITPALGRTCAMCGAGFTPTVRHHNRQRFCSKQCREAHWHAANPNWVTQYSRRWRATNPERARKNSRRYHFQKTYGLSLEVAEEMLAKGCAICGGQDKLHIDHDHRTGKVRGCLCEPCNHGVGRFRDNPDFLRAAADYVERAKGVA